MKGSLKRCPSCGKFFTCTGNEDCWCESFQIHKKDFVELTAKYNDCICKNCLKEYTKE